MADASLRSTVQSAGAVKPLLWILKRPEPSLVPMAVSGGEYREDTYDLEPKLPHIHAFGGTAAHARYPVRVAAGRHSRRDGDARLLEIHGGKPYYAHLGRPLAEVADLIPCTN